MGLTKSCGCLNNENRKTIGHNNKIDLSGKRFGRLEVIQDSGKRTKHRQIIWTCKCNCGTILEVSSGNLRSGNTLSCGCLNSYGEEFISRLLTKHDIHYTTQITFPDLLDKKPLRFDFGIYKDNKLIQLIEYDGKQHYDSSLPFYSETMVSHDRAKDEYCKRNNIPLLRIKREDLTNELLERIMYENSIS